MTKDTFEKEVLNAETTLYRVAKTILIQESDCEDAVQEAILKAYEKLDTLREEKYFKTWLVRILMNECYRIIKERHGQISFEDYGKELEADNGQPYSELQEYILKLPDKIRIAVVLYYIEGYSIIEIGHMLRIPAGTVKSRLSKGRKLLREKMEHMEVVYDGI